MPDRDPFDLARFVEAQKLNYAAAIDELRAGRKRTHWSWYVLPQLRGLGRSSMSSRYGLSGAAEARAYLDHPVLGARLRECVLALNGHAGADAATILGDVDAQKLHSCLTLFDRVAPGESFERGLIKYFHGSPDPLTVAALAG